MKKLPHILLHNINDLIMCLFVLAIYPSLMHLQVNSKSWCPSFSVSINLLMMIEKKRKGKERKERDHWFHAPLLNGWDFPIWRGHLSDQLPGSPCTQPYPMYPINLEFVPKTLLCLSWKYWILVQVQTQRVMSSSNTLLVDPTQTWI